MLGQSIVLFGPPLALGLALGAYARGIDRAFTFAALALGGIEALLLAWLLWQQLGG